MTWLLALRWIAEQGIFFVIGYYSMDALAGVRQMISSMRFEAPR